MIGSFRCAAVHSAWMLYMALPSPTIATTGRPGNPRLMPTAPAIAKPIPPLASP